MDVQERIEAFLKGDSFAVVGASSDRAKYGNKVLRCYLQNARKVFAVNPREAEVEGVRCYPDLAALPAPVHGVSIITPPPITERIVDEAIAAGIQHLWMQPGAESAKAVRNARDNGLSVISGGPCLLVVLGFRER